MVAFAGAAATSLRGLVKLCDEEAMGGTRPGAFLATNVEPTRPEVGSHILLFVVRGAARRFVEQPSWGSAVP